MSERRHKRYTREFKLEGIRLADGSNKPVTLVARELGLRVNQTYVNGRNNGSSSMTMLSRAVAGPQTRMLKSHVLKKALAAACEKNAFLKKQSCALRGTSHETCDD